MQSKSSWMRNLLSYMLSLHGYSILSCKELLICIQFSHGAFCKVSKCANYKISLSKSYHQIMIKLFPPIVNIFMRLSLTRVIQDVTITWLTLGLEGAMFLGPELQYASPFNSRSYKSSPNRTKFISAFTILIWIKIFYIIPSVKTQDSIYEKAFLRIMFDNV